MGTLKFRGGLGAILLALSAAIASAAPWTSFERSAANKPSGNYQIQQNTRQFNRSYSFVPNTVWTPSTTQQTQTADTQTQTQQTQTSDTTGDNTAQQNTTNRNFSYQPQAQTYFNNNNWQNRRAPRTPSYINADRKPLDSY